MEDYGAMIRNVFELGSIRDAELLFDAIVKNAFPTNDFRRLELIRFVKNEQYMESRFPDESFHSGKSACLGSNLPPCNHGYRPGKASLLRLSKLKLPAI